MLSLLTFAATATSAVLAASSGLDSSLHRSFWGLAYNPDGVILPDCGVIQTNVTRDIGLIAQLTPRVRLYGGDCNQTAMVLQGIQDTNADLEVWPTVYIGVPYNQTVVDRQFNAILDALKTYGVDHIGGISIGNEFLLDSYGDDGTATDSAGVAARKQLLSTIATLNETLLAENFDKTIPIGTSDAGSAVTEALCEGIDFYMANDHPWFGSVPIDEAAGWTWQFWETNDVATCAKASNNASTMIGETGWPTESMNSSEATNGPSEASVADLQTFLDTFVCQANTNSTPYFFFEFSDQPWTKIYGGVEPYWGLYDSSRNLKDVTIPDCTVTSPSGGTVDQLKLGSSSTSGSSSDAKSPAQRSSMLPAATVVACLVVLASALVHLPV